MASKDLRAMETIMEQKSRDIARDGQPALTPETIALAEFKRETFDMPINVAKVDPLR